MGKAQESCPAGMVRLMRGHFGLGPAAMTLCVDSMTAKHRISIWRPSVLTVMSFQTKKEPCLGSIRPGLKPVRLVSELESGSVPKRNGRGPAKDRVVTAFRSGTGRSLVPAMFRVPPVVPHRLRQLERSQAVRAPSGLSTCRVTWRSGLPLVGSPARPTRSLREAPRFRRTSRVAALLGSMRSHHEDPAPSVSGVVETRARRRFSS